MVLEHILPQSLNLTHPPPLISQRKSLHWDWKWDCKAMQTTTELFQLETLKLNGCPYSPHLILPYICSCTICVHFYLPYQTFFLVQGQSLRILTLPRCITSSNINVILPKFLKFTDQSRLSVLHTLHNQKIQVIVYLYNFKSQLPGFAKPSNQQTLSA